MIALLSGSIIETIQFYADCGDLPTAAHMALVFFCLLGFRTNAERQQEASKFQPFLIRVLKSYFDALS